MNHEFLLDFIKNNMKDPNARFLDFGCGSAEVVLAGRKEGLEIYGTDEFYEGGNTRPKVERLGLLGTIVTEITNNRTVYPDNHFDIVVNNQVLEHAQNLEAVLRELNRVLKPGGKLLSLFPSKEVWWEGHRCIPLLHRFPKNSVFRVYFAYLWRLFGKGAHKEGKTRIEWARYSCDWIDKYTFYRPLGKLEDY